MDTSRVADLEQLRFKMFDMSVPYYFRTMAGRSYYKVQKQVKDHRLTSLRQQLIRSHLAADKENIEVIGELVRRHEKRSQA